MSRLFRSIKVALDEDKKPRQSAFNTTLEKVKLVQQRRETEFKFTDKKQKSFEALRGAGEILRGFQEGHCFSTIRPSVFVSWHLQRLAIPPHSDGLYLCVSKGPLQSHERDFSGLQNWEESGKRTISPRGGHAPRWSSVVLDSERNFQNYMKMREVVSPS